MASEGLIIKIAANASEFVSGADKAVKDVKGKFKGLGDEISKELKRVETVGTTAFKGITGAIGGMATAATAAIGGMVKESVGAFAEYEQLEGGIKKLFQNDANYVINRASAAFKTAGMSANEYMQNVTGFSAALINTLGGDTYEAARMADMAMRDIADNANTYGKYSAQELAGVYQALAKGTYTTLDNLNLGFGGSKEGMEALIRKAEELDASFKVVHKTGKSGTDEITFGFNDMVQAIHIVQENMRIAGTTENEAAKTISGSITMMNKAWENLKVNLLQGEIPLDESINDLVDSVEKVIQNAGPAIEKSLKGLGMLIQKALPALLDFGIPALVEDVLPGIGAAAVALVESLASEISKNLGKFVDFVSGALPNLVNVGVQLITSILEGISSNISSIKDSAGTIITSLADGIRSVMQNLLPIAKDLIGIILSGFIEYKTLIFEMGIQIITALVDGIADSAPTLGPQLVDAVLHLLDVLIENLPTLIDATVTIITELTNAIMAKLPDLLGKVGQVVYDLCNKLLDHLPELLQDAVKIVAAVLALVAEILLAALISIGQHLANWWNSSIKPWFDKIGENIKNFFSTLGKAFEFWWNSTIRPWFEKIKTDIKTKIEEIKTNVTNKVEEIKSKVSEKVKGIFETIVNTIQELPGRMLDIGRNIVEGIWDGISGAANWIGEKVSGFVDHLVGGVKGLLGINSPSKVFAQIGAYMGEGLAEGLESETGALQKTAEKQIGQLTGIYNGLSAGMPQINLAGRMNAFRMGQTSQTITNDNGNVFNFTNYFTGSGAEAGDELFRQFQRRVRYSGGVL